MDGEKGKCFTRKQQKDSKRRGRDLKGRFSARHVRAQAAQAEGRVQLKR